MNNNEKKIKFGNDNFRDALLFKNIDNRKVLNIPKSYEEKENEYLKCIDLSGIDWTNVDVRGINFKGTNAKVNPRLVYLRSLEGTNLEGIDLSNYSLRGVNITNANLTNTNAHLYSNDMDINYKLVSGCYIDGKYIITLNENDYISIDFDKKERKHSSTINKLSNYINNFGYEGKRVKKLKK